MAHREPSIPHTIVDIEDYSDNLDDRLLAEDFVDPNEVYVLYAPLKSRMSRAAIRAFVSFDVATRDPTGMKVGGTLSFRDNDLTLLGPGGVFKRDIIGGLISYDPSDPITVRRHGFKIPIVSGILVRGDETFDGELEQVRTQLDLERDSELVTN